MTTKVTSLVLANTTVSATNYGGLTQIPSFAVDAQGRLTFAANNAVSSISISSGQITGLAASATTDTTNANNITSGTLPSARLTGTYNISVSGNANTVTNGVYTTGNQTIAGVKTFSSTPVTTTPSVSSNDTSVATTAFVRSIIPAGVILMWSGSIASIPTGWLLCNGTSGTPDLRDRFIVGAGSTYAVAATGGSANATLVSHTHTISDPGHTHTYGFYGNAFGGFPGTFAGDYNSGGSTTIGIPTQFGTASASSGGLTIDSASTGITATNSSGSSATNANLPPYYALAYIMKS